MMPPPAVILGTPVVHAEGGTTGVSGIQRNKGCCPVITGADDEGDTARSSGLPGTSRAMTGWRTRVNRKAILFFFWFPAVLVAPPAAGRLGQRG